MRLCEALAAVCLGVLLLILVTGCDDIEDPEPRCPVARITPAATGEALPG